MKLPQDYRSRIHGLTLAISGLLITGRHSGTEEISATTKRRMDGEKIEFIPPADPEVVWLEEVEIWKARHPGFKFEIRFPHKEERNPFELPNAQLKNGQTQKFQHPGMKKPPRMWQPDNRIPFRPKQEGLQTNLKKPKSPYR